MLEWIVSSVILTAVIIALRHTVEHETTHYRHDLSKTSRASYDSNYHDRQ